MHATDRRHVDAFLGKVGGTACLTAAEREAVAALPQKIVHVDPRTRIVAEGERPTRCCMVVAGMVARSKLSRSGRRQIISFHLPGDMVDLQTVLFKIADHSIESLRAATIATIPHAAVLELGARFPAIGRAFWFDTLVDSSIQRESLLNVGRRDAAQRAAHLLCELVVRFDRIGRADGLRIALDPTQGDIADALGITPIHVNRVLARMRAQRLIAIEGRTLAVLDWKALAALGEFDPTYLHLEGPTELHI